MIAQLDKLKENFELIPVCPEQLGGLSTPRAPSEIIGGNVINSEGTDVTEFFIAGAEITHITATKNRCKLCLLKERSPSCGVHQIYSGDFSGSLINGAGVTTALLLENGFKVFSEEEIDLLLNY